MGVPAMQEGHAMKITVTLRTDPFIDASPLVSARALERVSKRIKESIRDGAIAGRLKDDTTSIRATWSVSE